MTSRIEPVRRPTSEAERAEAAAGFATLRDRLCAAFEALEDAAGTSQLGQLPAGRFERQSWERPGGGGGTMAILRGGRVFEKVGVNISVVHGALSENFRGQIAGSAESGGRFWAAGISVVAHPQSPFVPAAHMNTRAIATGFGWFGGGADLTPVEPDPADTAAFHAALKDACNRHDPAYYERFKAWCDEYFFLKHRQEPRGVGGIFFDQLATGDWARDFAFTRDVGLAFGEVYPALVRRHLGRPWTPEQRQRQLVRRGRYVEFNLLYDRGTTFGLMTGGNVEAILMSLPPLVAWP